MPRNCVLTVDDSRVMRRIIADAIESLGYEPLAAENGKEALDRLDERGDEVALILLDWNMPVMNGYDALKAMKADPRFCDIPVMMVTTESERSNVIAAIQAGASHYLSKPFTSQDLVIRMMETLGVAS